VSSRSSSAECAKLTAAVVYAEYKHRDLYIRGSRALGREEGMREREREKEREREVVGVDAGQQCGSSQVKLSIRSGCIRSD
jgi:hypothetical protein